MSTKENTKPDDGTHAKGKGFFGGLKDLLIEDDGKDDEGDKPEPVPKPNGGHAVTTAPPPLPPTPAAYGAVAPDPQIRALLEKDVQVAAAPALTALEAMCANLAGVIPDEGKRIEAGLAAIKGQHTLAAVITDVDECLAALDQKSNENAASVQAAIQNKVGAREAALAAMDQTIADKRAQIEQVQREIAELEANKVKEASAIAVDRQKIDAKNASFNATLAAYRAELLAKKQKITANGKGT